MIALVESYDGRSEAGWWDRIRLHSLGWVVARLDGGSVAGFVNVAWDGSDHAFLVDTKVRRDVWRRGIGQNSSGQRHDERTPPAASGCTSTSKTTSHQFYFQGCGFAPTAAGLIRLRA